MIKLFVSDIDGTIFDHTVGVPTENVEALLRLQANQVKMVLASGRAIPAMVEIAEMIQLKEHKGYLIASNGAEVYDCEKGVFIHQALVPVNILRDMYQFCLENELFFSCVQGDVLYYSFYDQAVEHEKYHGKFQIEKINRAEDIKLDSLKCSVNINMDADPKNMDAFEKKFKPYVSIERLSSFYMDVQSIGQCKRLGLERLCKYLNIGMHEVAAILNWDNVCDWDGFYDEDGNEISGIWNDFEIVEENTDYFSLYDSYEDMGVIVKRLSDNKFFKFN